MTNPPWCRDKVMVYYYLLKMVGSARQRESDVHPISPKTPAQQYRPIDRKKRKGQRVEDYSREEQLSHTIEYGVSKIVPEGHRREFNWTASTTVLQSSAARQCISVPMCDQSTACNPHWHI